MQIMQGDQYAIKIYGSGFEIENVAEIEFTIGNLTKKYPGEVTYQTPESGDPFFSFPVTQEETLTMPSRVGAQARVLMEDGDVIGDDMGTVDIRASMTRTVL